jgi:Mn-dependent DtxR family transcriptional regulator
MSVQTMDADELTPLHREILSIMLEGRDEGEPWGYATPRSLATRTGESRQLVSKRLRDLQMADVVDKEDRGFYKLNPEEVPTHE